MSDLRVRSLEKFYGSHGVLRDIDLDIRSGEFVVFVGPSGCGKSTLLRMIAGLEDITAGEVEIDGKVVNEVEPARRGIGDGLPVIRPLPAYDGQAEHELRT